ncbi:DoxX family protein [uncultured Cyclobacterium sp.]|uniref:DoxX family protein n=1 Tax=uncultured Cyclobacterium sp. TaxID=453820 RepID=UPI0030EB8BBE
MANQEKNKAIHISLWIAQVLLAVMFILAGLMKATQPIEALTESLPWVSSTSLGLVRFIGISELLGGIGLILPALLRIKPFLTIWAAIGLAVVMVLAAIFHASRGEYSGIGVNLVFMAIALFVAWGRSKKVPILAK